MHPLLLMVLVTLVCVAAQQRFFDDVYLDTAATSRPFPHLMARLALVGVFGFGNP